MGELTDNDRRVLDAVEWTSREWDGLMPHGACDYTALRRLTALGLVETKIVGVCQSCNRDPRHEGPIYTLTAAGRDALHGGG